VEGRAWAPVNGEGDQREPGALPSSLCGTVNRIVLCPACKRAVLARGSELQPDLAGGRGDDDEPQRRATTVVYVQAGDPDRGHGRRGRPHRHGPTAGCRACSPRWSPRDVRPRRCGRRDRRCSPPRPSSGPGRLRLASPDDNRPRCGRDPHVQRRAAGTAGDGAGREIDRAEVVQADRGDGRLGTDVQRRPIRNDRRLSRQRAEAVLADEVCRRPPLMALESVPPRSRRNVVEGLHVVRCGGHAGEPVRCEQRCRAVQDRQVGVIAVVLLQVLKKTASRGRRPAGWARTRRPRQSSGRFSWGGLNR